MFVSGGRPQDLSTLHRTADRTGPVGPAQPGDLTAQLARRRAASWRLPPLDTGWRDPWHRVADRRTPSDFGLRRRELAGEVGRCRAHGWQRWEIAERFTDPRRVAA